MRPENQTPRRSKQTHTMEGPPEEFINEYDADDNQEGMHSRIVPARTPPNAARSKNGVMTVIGKILSFLHR